MKHRIKLLLLLPTLLLAACGQREELAQPKEVINQWNSSAQVGDQTTVLHEIAYDDGTICSSFTNPDDNRTEEECW
jgi:hypothetical protein